MVTRAANGGPQNRPRKQLTALEKFKVRVLAVATGVAFMVDRKDPFPGLVDEAIRRAEEKAASKAA